MQLARDVMQPVVKVGPSAGLKELAQAIVSADADGLCVVDAQGVLLGVVTEMDLVFQDKRPQLPTLFSVFDLVLQFGTTRANRELAKIAASRAEELMTAEPLTARPDTPIDELASLMLEHHVSVVPIVEHDRLVGMVTRRIMARRALKHLMRTDAGGRLAAPVDPGTTQDG